MWTQENTCLTLSRLASWRSSGPQEPSRTSGHCVPRLTTSWAKGWSVSRSYRCVSRFVTAVELVLVWEEGTTCDQAFLLLIPVRERLERTPLQSLKDQSKIWKARFFILCDVIFLVGLQGKLKLITFGSERVFHSLLRWNMIILPILTTSVIHFSLKGWENVLFEQWLTVHITQFMNGTGHFDFKFKVGRRSCLVTRAVLLLFFRLLIFPPVFFFLQLTDLKEDDLSAVVSLFTSLGFLVDGAPKGGYDVELLLPNYKNTSVFKRYYIPLQSKLPKEPPVRESRLSQEGTMQSTRVIKLTETGALLIVLYIR